MVDLVLRFLMAIPVLDYNFNFFIYGKQKTSSPGGKDNMIDQIKRYLAANNVVLASSIFQDSYLRLRSLSVKNTFPLPRNLLYVMTCVISSLVKIEKQLFYDSVQCF